MVLKSSVLSCLLPARLGFGPHQKPDPPPRTHSHALGEPEFDPFRCSDPPRARANTAPSSSLPPLLIPDIGESPTPAHRSLAPPVRPKRSSFTTFFAFSSKSRPAHDAPIVHHSVPGRQVQLINSASVPSPLRTEEEDYYYSYYASSPSPHPDTTSKHRQQDLIGNPDLDSQLSSPADSHIRHPFSYSPHSKQRSDTTDTAPPLRHATSQPLHHHPHASAVNAGRIPTSHGAPHLQSELKTSVSTPNLAASVRPRSLIRKKPTRSKTQDRWLSAETWWDALFSPSPRFKVKQAPRPDPTIVNDHVSKPVQREPNSNLGVTFPSVPAVRPRAVSATSATSNTKPTFPALPRSRSAMDLFGQPSTSQRAGFEPALETLVDEPTPPPEQVPGSDAEFPLPDPPLSLAQ